MHRLTPFATAMFLLLAFCAGVRAQGPRLSTILQPEALRADAETLRRALEAVHPGLYRYNTPAEFDERWRELARAWEKPQTRVEAFVALSRFTASIRCGHTFPNPANHSKAVVGELFSGRDRLPCCFRWIRGRMIVTRNLSADERLAPGAEIRRINGVPVDRIRDEMLTLARADGGNDAKRLSLLEVTGIGRFETFDVYFPLLFPMTTTEFELEVAPFGGAPASVTVPALTREEREATSRAADGSEGGKALWELAWIDERTAYLPMATWVAYNTTWDWTGFLHDTFRALDERKAEALIIDLRGNEGGSSVGDVILSHLIERPIARLEAHRFVKYLKTPTELDPALDTWDPSFKDWTKDAIGPVDLSDWRGIFAAGAPAKFYRLRNENGLDPAETDEMIEPAPPRFTGRVVVLVDASNSSATFEFARRVKSLGVGTLIGRPTGGNLRGINGGAFFFVRLPGSGLEVDVPIIGQFPKAPGNAPADAGVIPDIIVEPSVEDIARGVDTDMRAARRFLATPR